MSEVIPLNYASGARSFGIETRRLFRGMLLLAIFSGLCVAAAFYAVSGSVVAGLVHIVVFAVTIFVALRVGRELQGVFPRSEDPNSSTRLTLDLLALLGLVVIALAPIGYHLAELLDGRNLLGHVGVVIVGLAYTLLAGSTARHLMLYRLLADSCRQINRLRMAKGLILLGWVKTIYEAIWLATCAMTLLLLGTNAYQSLEEITMFLAFTALFATFGFGAIWIWMIVVHAMLLRLARGEHPRIVTNAQELQ